MPTPPPETPAWLQHIDHWAAEVGRHPFAISLLGAWAAYMNGFLGKAGEVPVQERRAAALLCVLAGVFGGPAFNDWAKIESKNVAAAIILGCSIAGAVVIKAVFQYLRDKEVADWPIVGPFFARMVGKPLPPKE